MDLTDWQPPARRRFADGEPVEGLLGEPGRLFEEGYRARIEWADGRAAYFQWHELERCIDMWTIRLGDMCDT